MFRSRVWGFALVGSSLGFIAGCGPSSSDFAAPNAPAHVEYNPESPEPLSVEQVQTVLKVASSLGGQLPSFKYIEATPVSHFAPASQIVHLTQNQLAMRLDTQRQGEWWDSQTLVQDAMNEHHINGERLAQLLLQISCGWKRLQTEKSDLEAYSVSFEEQIAHLSTQLTELQQHDLLSDRVRQEEARQVTERLRIAAIMQFYGRLLDAVPDQDLKLLAHYENQLAPIVDASGLLNSGGGDSTETIRPVSYGVE